MGTVTASRASARASNRSLATTAWQRVMGTRSPLCMRVHTVLDMYCVACESHLTHQPLQYLRTKTEPSPSWSKGSFEHSDLVMLCCCDEGCGTLGRLVHIGSGLHQSAHNVSVLLVRGHSCVERCRPVLRCQIDVRRSP